MISQEFTPLLRCALNKKKYRQSTKITKGNSILAKIRQYIPETLLRNVYNAHIQPHLDYGALIWGQCAPTHINIIKESQSKAVRIINFKYKDTPANPLFINSKILPLKENLKFLQGKFMWRVVHNFLPESMLDLFVTHESKRESNKDINRLNLPIVNTEHGKKIITFSGANYWNKTMPNNITHITTSKLFKIKFKLFLFNSLDLEV